MAKQGMRKDNMATTPQTDAGKTQVAKEDAFSAKTGQGGVGDAISDVADRAASGIDAAIGYDKGKTTEVISEAKQATGQVVGQVRQQATNKLDQQKETAVEGLTCVADALRQMDGSLREQDKGPVAQYAAKYGDAIAERIDRFSGYLRDHNINQLVDEVQTLARRQPALFLGGAFLLGLAGARFLKSSRPAPDMASYMPDPNRALPPAARNRPETTPGI